MEIRKGIDSLIVSVTNDLKRDLDCYNAGQHPMRYCRFYYDECKQNMRQYAECGSELCEHKCEYCDTFKWTIDRAKQYADISGKSVFDILEAFESRRDYWYMNFYQECNQPDIKHDNVKTFDTYEAFRKSLDGKGYRCPACGGISSHPQKCDSGIKKNGKVCDWKSFGLLGTMGKGVYIFILEDLAVVEIFQPVAWEGK